MAPSYRLSPKKEPPTDSAASASHSAGRVDEVDIGRYGDFPLSFYIVADEYSEVRTKFQERVPKASSVASLVSSYVS